MKWHILGTGAIGCLLASHLRNQKHKVSLLLRSEQHLKAFQAQDNSIFYQRENNTKQISGFEASVIGDKTNNNIPIENLIIATKAHHTAKALEPILSRLNSNSTILLLQNGMGVVDELNQLYWQSTIKNEKEEKLQQRPRVLVGVNRHAVERIAPYHIIHHSGWNDPVGGLFIGEYFTNRIPHDAKDPLEFETTLKNISDLRCEIFTWKELYEKMVKKLIVNASINPVASMLNVKNGELVNNEYTKRIMFRVCRESASIIKDDLPNESTESIYKMVMDTCQQVAGNTCSMLQDIKNNQATEIDYINGYLCKLAKDRGVDAATNRDLVDFIHAKEKLYL